jgi:hypothetical protein
MKKDECGVCHRVREIKGIRLVSGGPGIPLCANCMDREDLRKPFGIKSYSNVSMAVRFPLPEKMVIELTDEIRRNLLEAIKKHGQEGVV